MVTTKNDELTRCSDELREWFDGRPVYTRTDYGRGETDYVRVYVATNDSRAFGLDHDHPRIVDLTYHVATVIGAKQAGSRGIPRKGAQYNKALDTLDSAFYALGMKLDQTQWSELA